MRKFFNIHAYQIGHEDKVFQAYVLNGIMVLEFEVAYPLKYILNYSEITTSAGEAQHIYQPESSYVSHPLNKQTVNRHRRFHIHTITFSLQTAKGYPR